MILEARGVVCSFGATRALDHVEVSAEGGQTLAVFGGNGAGKSTLLRVLSGERPPDSGSVTVDGSPLSGKDPGWRAKLALVSHQTGLYRNLTVAENLTFFAKLHGVGAAESRTREVAKSVGAEGFLDRQVGQLSRGQGQRVSLARALLHDPEVLLLDEPFTGLDPSGSGALQRALGKLRAAGRIIILVTHDVPRGLQLSDRAVVLRRGSKVLDEASARCTVEGINEHFGSAEHEARDPKASATP